MKILVVSANPKRKDGLGELILNNIESDFEVETINLYDYNLPFYSEEQKLSAEANKIFAKLAENENWLFVFPVWWSNMPAILKNFFDWGIKFGLIYDGKSVPKPALEGQGKKAAVFCTSGDVYDEYKEEVTKLVAEEILPFWGVEVVGSFFIEDTYNFDDSRFQESSNRLSELLKRF